MIGIIGGSGLEDPNFLGFSNEEIVETPYGAPSSKLVFGVIDKNEVIIISRHGKNHEFGPSKVNYRANMCALKNEGCTHILATTACGSLRQGIQPGDFVFPDQFIDRTRKREDTFFDDGPITHTPMGDSFSYGLRKMLVKQSERLGFPHHNGGTVVTIEGPRFSSRAESLMFKSWGCDIINMSTVPEVVLARELDLEYQSIAMVTDYDCWYETEEEVSMELILKVMQENAENVKELIKNVVPEIESKL